MTDINAFGLLALFGITIVVGYVGSIIFDKTKISDIIWLLAFGILIGPVFHFMDRNLFLVISPFLAALALILILFDAGLNMDFYQMLRGAPRSIALAFIGVFLEVAAMGAVAHYVIGMPVLESILLATMLGGASTIVVMSLVSKLNVQQNVKTILNLESIFTDPLVIVLAIALLNIIANGAALSIKAAASSIASNFAVGAVAGLVFGFVWLLILNKLKGRPFDYMLTLAVLFLLYVGAENIGGSGAIASLAFGLMLGNGHIFGKLTRARKQDKQADIGSLLKGFQAEISFFVRSFFFVYLGIIATVTQQYFYYGLLVAAVAIVIRFVSVQICTVRMRLGRLDKAAMQIMGPKGLAAAVLAQLPLAYGLPNPELYTNIVFVVIFATVLYSSFATLVLFRDSGKPRQKLEVKSA